MNALSRRFLLAMWEGGGTIPPQLGIARRLIARGHHVHVLGDPTIRERAEAVGCGFSPWRRAPHRTSLDPAQDLLRDWELSNPMAKLGNFRDKFVAGPAGDVAADTTEVLGVVQPHVVLSDHAMFGTLIAARAAGLPTVALIPNIWMAPIKGAPAVGPGFRPPRTVLGRARDGLVKAMATRVFNRGLPAINAARAAHGLSPISGFWDQVLTADQILVLTSARFDLAAPHVPGNVRYTGPILDDPQWAEPWSPPWPADNDDPIVLVGFTSNFQDQGPLLRRVVEALSTLPVRAVVTRGQMLDADEVTGTANVAVVASARHNQILAEAALAVTHCGHGTTMKALAAGVPMVCVPMGRDQDDNAARVVHHGAGVRLSPRAAVAAIRSAVLDVLGNDRYRAGAAAMAAAIAEEAQSVDAVTEIEAVARMAAGPASAQR
jgi:MGT family glycosyltransferase